MTSHATRIAIIGAGKGGMALLDLLHQIPDVEIVGITDKDPAAPGLQRARDLHVLVEPHVSDLIQNEQVGLIMDVTGDPSMNAMFQAMKRPDAEVLSGAATRLLWKLVQHQSTLEAELFQADKLAGLGSFAAGIAHDINNPLQLILGLAENLVDEPGDAPPLLLPAHVLAGLVARLHAYFLVLEMFLSTTPFGQKTFKRTKAQQEETAVLAKNQGLYNGFLAAGLLWGAGLGADGRAIAIFFLLCVILAGIFGAPTVNRRILWVQAAPAAVALLLVVLTSPA